MNSYDRKNDESVFDVTQNQSSEEMLIKLCESHIENINMILENKNITNNDREYYLGYLDALCAIRDTILEQQKKSKLNNKKRGK